MRRASRFHGALAGFTALVALVACSDTPPQPRATSLPRTSDASGLAASATAGVTIRNVAPTVTVGSTATVYSGGTFDLSATFADPDVIGAPWATSIDWGDGSATRVATGNRSAPVTGSRRYVRTGSYTVRVTVTDKDGGAGSATVALTVARFPTLIDVGPKDPTNTVAVRGGSQTVDVALLSTPTFDARTVVPTSVRLTDGRGPGARLAQAKQGKDYSFTDVNRDGLVDVLLICRKADMIASGDLRASTTRLILLADASDGRETRGEDLVSIQP